MTDELFVQSHDDYERQYTETVNLLKQSVCRYDDGSFAEAKPIASLIAKLVEDRGTNLSLLSRLGRKPAQMFDNSLYKEDRSKTDLYGPYVAQGYLSIGRNLPVPILDGLEDHPDWFASSYSPFDAWWEGPVVRDGQGQTLSRRSVVKTMRDKEAQHTDSGLPITYGKLAYRQSINHRSVDPVIDNWDDNMTHLIVRQTAHEILRTIEPSYPKKFSIKAGDKAYPFGFVTIAYRDETDELKPVHHYCGYSFQTLLASSKNAADAWTKTREQFGQYVPPPINFYGEAKPSNFRPDAFRIMVDNYFPYAPTVSAQFGVDDNGLVTVLVTVLSIR